MGACYYPRGRWDSFPGNVDVDRKRLWDWRDTTISRAWRAGRAEPSLYFELWALLEAGAYVRQDRAWRPPERPRAEYPVTRSDEGFERTTKREPRE